MKDQNFFHSDGVKEPLDYFKNFIDENILEEIVYYSNLYFIHNNPDKALNLTAHELEQWLQLLLNFYISKLLTTRMHWNR